MSASVRRLVRRVLPGRFIASIAAFRRRRGRPRIRTGSGKGLLFDPGKSNPAYGIGDNELPVQDALAGHLQAGAVFHDIGANVGFFTVIAARLVGCAGHVYAFEPVPDNAALIRKNCQLSDLANVTVVEKAVSDTTGGGELVLARYSGGAALSTAAPPPDATGTLAVELTTVDDEVRSGRVRSPSVVKIDVEGAELEVLTGMAQTIHDHRPVIVCEIDDATQSGFARKYESCVGFLRSVDYDVRRLADSYPGAAWHVGHFVAVPSSHVDGS